MYTFIFNSLGFSQKKIRFVDYFFLHPVFSYFLEMVIVNIDSGFRKLLIPHFNIETLDMIHNCNKH